MSKKTHQQQLAQRKALRQAERQAERARQRKMLAITLSAIVAVVVVIAVVFVVLANTDDGTPAANETPSPTPSAPTSPGPENKPKSIPSAIAAPLKRPTPFPAEVDCTYKASGEKAAREVKAPANGKTTAKGTTPVTLDTSIGKLNLTLDSSLAPCAVKNFLSLAEQKFFDDTICQRMTVGAGVQVLQCGDPTGTSSGGPGYSFADEVYPNIKYGRGILAMANSGPNTNGSQFFVVYGHGDGLESLYTPFGTIDAAGLKVLDDVARAGVLPEGGATDGKPFTEVRIKTAAARS